MTRADIDASLAAANPLSRRAAALLSLHGAEVELLERIIAIPVSPYAAHTRRVSAPRRSRLALVLAAAAVTAAVLTVVPFGSRSVGPAPAFAASLIRFANHTPRVLLRLPGWRVDYVYQQPGGDYGEMHFIEGGSGLGGQLVWYRATPAIRRYIAGGHETARTGLGAIARRFVFEGRSHGVFTLRAFFIYRGRELYFTGNAPSMAMYRRELLALTAVDTTTWLRAMPPSVIRSAESGHVVRQMLKGIPLPRGFNAARIRGSRLVQDRYYLGVDVTGTVACMWIADWNHARKTGDELMAHRAVAAMATAPHWPVLKQMARNGGWSGVLIQIAHAMRRGNWYGRSLAAAANPALGCSQLGVRLGR